MAIEILLTRWLLHVWFCLNIRQWKNNERFAQDFLCTVVSASHLTLILPWLLRWEQFPYACNSMHFHEFSPVPLLIKDHEALRLSSPVCLTCLRWASAISERDREPWTPRQRWILMMILMRFHWNECCCQDILTAEVWNKTARISSFFWHSLMMSLKEGSWNTISVWMANQRNLQRRGYMSTRETKKLRCSPTLLGRLP